MVLSRRSKRVLTSIVGALVVTTSALPAISTGAEAQPAPIAAAPVVAARGGSLSASPMVFMPGQALTFTGNLGRPGRRAVRLQSNLNRAGDVWLDVPGTGFRTKANGSFRYTFPGPSMFGISYRVSGGGLSTRSVLFNPRPEEITLSLVGEAVDSQFYTVAPGAAFTVVADATPAVRAALGTPPPIPGRTITLQERANGNRWATIGTASADANGEATFQLTAPASGQRVLRARQERWTAGQDQIGWYASFPSYFTVGTAETAETAAGAAARTSPVAVAPASSARSAARPTASGRYKWGTPVFDFGWERGQDLDSPPSLGSRLKGSWQDTSDGTGRVASFNGGLVLQSKLVHGGPGDLGTTTATLQGNSQKAGRWEFRLQGHVFERGDQPYRLLVELVPQGAPVTTCSPASVVVADFSLGSAGMGVGVRSRSAGAVWSRRVGGNLGETPFNVAVEVGPDHVTWFRDGRPVATVHDRRARLGARLVPRLSLIGAQTEMSGAQVDSDWQRAYGYSRGRHVTGGSRVPRGSYSETC